MLLKKKNIQKIITNNLIQQTPPDTSDKETESVNPEDTIPLAHWLCNLQSNKAKIKNAPKNLSVIYSLNLSRSSLEAFPQEILQLSSLKFLILDENFIKVIPKNITTLNNLEMFSISNNRLDSLGSWLRKMTHLTYLNLSRNNIISLTEDFRFLKNLETLLIQENRFEKLPTCFHEMTKLKELGLDWFLFMNPSLEKTVIQRDKDPIFNNLMLLLRKKLLDFTFIEFISEFSEKNQSQEPFSLLLNKKTLFKCANNNNLGVLNILLKKNPNLINENNDDGLSLFTYSLINKNTFIPDILLDMNFPLNKGFGKYNSPLNLAISFLNIDIVIRLIKSGHSPCIGDYEGNTALHLLFDARFSQIPSQKAKEIMFLLLETGMSPNMENKAKFTPIHLAIKTDQYQAVEWALKYNHMKRGRNESICNLFDFDKKFGNFYFTAAHYAVFLANNPIIELFSQYPDEVDYFEKCKTGKTPRQVAYKSLANIKLALKCEKRFIKLKILNNLSNNTNINKIPEGITVNQMLKAKGFERPKALSEFHKNAPKKHSTKEISFKVKTAELDDMDESPMQYGSRIAFKVKTKDKLANDISVMDQKVTEFSTESELEEFLKIQNQILLKMQYKTVDTNTIEEIFENLSKTLRNNEIIFSDKIESLLYAKMFQYKLNLWVQKFSSKILPYSIFLINTFFNSPIKPGLYKKRVQTLQKYLINFAESLLKESNKEKIQNDQTIQNQLLFNEIIRTCLDTPQNIHDSSFSFEKFLHKSNSSLSNYEVFQAHKHLSMLKTIKKAIKTLPLKVISVKTTLITSEILKHSPPLQNIYHNGNKVCVGGNLKNTKKLLGITEEEMTILETTRRSSLKAYYFPSKQDFSPFQTKEKGGIK